MFLLTFIGRVKDGLILATSIEGDEAGGTNLVKFSNQAKMLFKKLNNVPSMQSLETGPFIFHYVVKGPICSLTLCDRSYPRKGAFAYLDDIANEFLNQYATKIDAVNRPYHFLEFDTCIQQAQRKYADRSRLAMTEVSSELHDVTRIMINNIEDVIHRGEALNILESRASDLSTISKKYKEDAKALNRRTTLFKIAVSLMPLGQLQENAKKSKDKPKKSKGMKGKQDAVCEGETKTEVVPKPDSQTEISGKKQKKDKQGKKHKKTSATSPSQAPARRRSFEAHVYFCGFTESEIENMTKDLPANVVVTQTLGTCVTHVVLKPNAMARKMWEWNGAFFSVLIGCWLLRHEWLIACQKDRDVAYEEPYEYKLTDIDIQFSGKRQDKESICTRQVVTLQEKYDKTRREGGQLNIFAHSVFNRVVIIYGKQPESRKRFKQMKVLMESVGAVVTWGDVWRQIKERTKRAKLLASCFIVIPGQSESRHDLGVTDEFIRSILLMRIPILYDEFVYKAIINQVVADHEMMILQSLTFWTDEAKAVQFSESQSRYVGCGVGTADTEEKHAAKRNSLNSTRSREPSLSTQSTSSATNQSRRGAEDDSSNGVVNEASKTKGKLALVSDCGKFSNTKTATEKRKMPESSSLSPHQTSKKKPRKHAENRMTEQGRTGNLFDEFNNECEQNAMGRGGQSYETTTAGDEDSLALTSLNILSPHYHTPIDDSDNYGMKSFSFCPGDLDSVNEVLTEIETPHKWVDTVAHLHISIPSAMARNGVEQARQSDSSVSKFNSVWEFLHGLTPSHISHDVFSCVVVEMLRNSIEDTFMPRATVLSKVFNGIGKPSYGLIFDADESVFRLISAHLRQFPPSNTGGRYYWLQALAEVNNPISKPANRRTVPRDIDAAVRLSDSVASFRKLVIDSFVGDGTSINMMEMLVSMLEADLFELSVRKGDYRHRRSSGRIQMQGFSVDLVDVPLAYLIFYEADYRKGRGLNSAAQKTVLQFVHFIAVYEGEPRLHSIAGRLLAVCLDALRWFCAEITQVFLHKDDIGIDLCQDIQRIGREFTKKKVTKKQLKDILPISWIRNCISNGDRSA